MHRLLSTLFCLAAAAVAQAHPPVGIVVDSRGNVFYSDLSQVWMITPAGERSIAVPDVHTHELYLDSADVLYGEHLWYEGEKTDRWGHRVWKRTPGGRVSEVSPLRAGLLQNYSFVRDAGGTMYWIDRDHSVIRKRLPDGTIALHAKLRLRDGRWMTTSADGTLYLIDTADLLKIDPSGRVTTPARGLAGRSLLRPHVGSRHRLMGLWTDDRGAVCVADYGAGEVKCVSSGRVTVVAKSTWPWSPTGGVLDRNGDLWILESSMTNAVRVRKIPRRERR